MVSPSVWDFYGDVYDRNNRKVKYEFSVIEDRAKMDDRRLGLLIQQTMDQIKQARIVPAGGVRERFGVYRGFGHLFKARWYRHRGVADYEVKRPYTRGFGGKSSAG
jgi:hypothetical protein